METADATTTAPGSIDLSIIVPCCNERAVLPKTYERLRTTCGSLGLTHEFVFIDDGSRDGTGDEIKRLAAADPAVRGVLLSRNFGHQAAVSAGYDHARGRAVLVMDADLQHPPELIPQFIAQWQAGYDVVYAYRQNVPTRLGYRLYNWLCDVRIPHEAADFRLLDRRVVDALRGLPERNRFVRGLVAWLGFRQVGIPYDQAPRAAGQPAYSWRKHLKLRIDSVFSFSTIPLRFSMLLGLVTLLLGVFYAAYIFVAIFLLRRPMAEGWPALIVTVLILGGVQLVCLGMVAEYIGRVYEEVKQRPLYVVRELTSGEHQPQTADAPGRPTGSASTP